MPKQKFFDIDVGIFDLNSLDLISILTLIESLDNSTLLEFSLINKYYRNLSRNILFKSMPLIPNLLSNKFNAISLFDIWFTLEDDKFNQEIQILNKNSIYCKTLIISTFSERIWIGVKQNFQNINTLILEVREIEELSIYDIIQNLHNIKELKVIFFGFKSTKKLGRIPNLPTSLTYLEVYIEDKVVPSLEMFQLLNSHRNLKTLKINNLNLLDGLLSRYPSLETLHANINTKCTSKLVDVISNIINLTSIDLIYPYLNNSLINKVKNLPKLKKHNLRKH